MSQYNSYMNVLSTGWSHLTKPERRSSEAYVAGAAFYTETSRHLGDIRNVLMWLAVECNMQPPLERREIRLHVRDEEIANRLGSTGISLLAMHEQAVDANLDAMRRLRDEDSRINLQLTGGSQV